MQQIPVKKRPLIVMGEEQKEKDAKVKEGMIVEFYKINNSENDVKRINDERMKYGGESAYRNQSYREFIETKIKEVASKEVDELTRYYRNIGHEEIALNVLDKYNQKADYKGIHEEWKRVNYLKSNQGIMEEQAKSKLVDLKERISKSPESEDMYKIAQLALAKESKKDDRLGLILTYSFSDDFGRHVVPDDVVKVLVNIPEVVVLSKDLQNLVNKSDAELKAKLEKKPILVTEIWDAIYGIKDDEIKTTLIAGLLDPDEIKAEKEAEQTKQSSQSVQDLQAILTHFQESKKRFEDEINQLNTKIQDINKKLDDVLKGNPQFKDELEKSIEEAKNIKEENWDVLRSGLFDEIDKLENKEKDNTATNEDKENLKLNKLKLFVVDKYGDVYTYTKELKEAEQQSEIYGEKISELEKKIAELQSSQRGGEQITQQPKQVLGEEETI